MREGEAVRLDRDDVDLEQGLLTIRDSKFGKSRQIPVHPSTVDALAGYAQRRDARTPRRDGRPNRARAKRRELLHLHNRHPAAARQRQHRVRVPGPRRRTRRSRADRRSPRLHDLRHSFAVNTLIRWYRQGLDVEQRLPLLSTYLGHVAPKSDLLVPVRGPRTARTRRRPAGRDAPRSEP